MASKLAQLVNDIRDSQIRMEGNIEHLSNSLAANRTDLQFAQSDINGLKAWRSKQGGIWFAIFVICGGASTIALIILGVLALV